MHRAVFLIHLFSAAVIVHVSFVLKVQLSVLYKKAGNSSVLYCSGPPGTKL